MIFKPKLNRYNLNTLVVLGNNYIDEFSKNRIRIAMVDKILTYNYSIFFLINKFMISTGLLKEAYADVILIYMKGNDYYIDDVITSDILM